MNSTEIDLGAREDHIDEVHLSAMYSAMFKMTMPTIKMNVIVVVDGGGVVAADGAEPGSATM